jgi:prophage regulatory protein
MAPAAPLHRIIRFSELPTYTGLHRSALESAIAAGEFPKPIKVGTRNIGWLESELIVWQQRKITQRELEAAEAAKTAKRAAR